jgi:hypothetical protein
VLAALISSTLLNCIFPFFTYVESSGMLGEFLPQVSVKFTVPGLRDVWCQHMHAVSCAAGSVVFSAPHRCCQTSWAGCCRVTQSGLTVILLPCSVICFALSTCGCTHVAVHMWLYTCGSPHVAVHMWLYTCGSPHVALHMWLSTCGCTHVAVHMWLYTCGCTHVAVHMWLYRCCSTRACCQTSWVGCCLCTHYSLTVM